jgi:hypothetical protein
MTSAYWQCGKCGALQLKDAEKRRAAELWIKSNAPVLGSDACEACGTRHDGDDVYRGRRDPPQDDAFIARILARPKTAHYNAVARIWTRKQTPPRDAVVMFALAPATVAQYRESASPLQLAAVALAKTSKEPRDLHTDEDGLVVPGERLKTDFPTWRVWLSDAGELWVTKQRVLYEDYGDEELPEQLKLASCAGPVPAIPYLVGLCMAAGLDPNKLSPIELRRLDEQAAARDA